jgi:transposase-like protein
MVIISYRRHRFPPVVIQHAVWLYLRFTLSYRDVEELLAERGLDISTRATVRVAIRNGWYAAVVRPEALVASSLRASAKPLPC